MAIMSRGCGETGTSLYVSDHAAQGPGGPFGSSPEGWRAHTWTVPIPVTSPELKPTAGRDPGLNEAPDPAPHDLCPRPP